MLGKCSSHRTCAPVVRTFSGTRLYLRCMCEFRPSSKCALAPLPRVAFFFKVLEPRLENQVYLLLCWRNKQEDDPHIPVTDSASARECGWRLSVSGPRSCSFRRRGFRVKSRLRSGTQCDASMSTITSARSVMNSAHGTRQPWRSTVLAQGLNASACRHAGLQSAPSHSKVRGTRAIVNNTQKNHRRTW